MFELLPAFCLCSAFTKRCACFVKLVKMSSLFAFLYLHLFLGGCSVFASVGHCRFMLAISGIFAPSGDGQSCNNAKCKLLCSPASCNIWLHNEVNAHLVG